MAAYLEAALEDGDPALVAAALGDIARAKGMADIARETGLGRESLYKALSPEGNPEFATVLKVVKALGLRLRATTGQPNHANASQSSRPRKLAADSSVSYEVRVHHGHSGGAGRRRQSA
jgi:probable addiction module antidote protein